MPILFLSLKILANLIGVALIFISLFLFETEEGDIQNWLEELWVKIDDLQRHAISRQVAFIRTIAEAILSIIIGIFGSRSLSVRSLCISTCFTITIVYQFIFLSSWVQTGHNPNLDNLGKTSIITFVYGILPLKISEKKWQAIWYIGFCYFIYIHFFQSFIEIISVGLKHNEPLIILAPIWMILGLGGATLLFTLFVIPIRKILAHLKEVKSVSKLIFILLLNLTPLLVLYGVWKTVIHLLIALARIPEEKFSGTSGHWLMGFLILVMFFIICISLISSIFLFLGIMFISLSITLLAHRAFWPFLSRAIYALQKFGVIKRRGATATIGLALIAVAWGKIEWLDKMSKVFEKLYPQ